MFDSMIIQLLFCGYIIWCRSIYQKSFCLPLHHELDLIEEENLYFLYDLKVINDQFYHLQNEGKYNDTKPYLNIVAS